MYSGGIGSWGAARRVAEQHGMADLRLLFTDTLIEDRDLYHFLVQSAAQLFCISLSADPSLPALWETLPEIYEDLDARKRQLRELRERTVRLIPGLIWLADGRTPWEVFFKERMLGNSRIDPCSKILKRELADRWRVQNCDPATTTVYVGIDWSEIHRFTRPADSPKGPGLRERMAERGWRYEAPLCDPPYLSKPQLLQEAQQMGLATHAAYADGYAHANCGSWCVKAGKTHFARLLRTHPRLYRYHEAREQEFRQFIGRDVSIMQEQRDKKKFPLTMATLRARIEGDEPQPTDEYGGCGCFVDEPEKENHDAQS
jgi:hypothetical protein